MRVLIIPISVAAAALPLCVFNATAVFSMSSYAENSYYFISLFAVLKLFKQTRECAIFTSGSFVVVENFAISPKVSRWGRSGTQRLYEYVNYL